MKKTSEIIYCILSAALCVVFFAVALSAGRNTSVATVRCFQYSPAYDLAKENGYDIYLVYSYNHIDFSKSENELEYEEYGEGLRVTGYTGADSTVYIPETHNGLPVTAVGEHAFNEADIDTIYLPKSVTELDCRFAVSRYDAPVKDSLLAVGLMTAAALAFTLLSGKGDRDGLLFGKPFGLSAFIVLCVVAAAAGILAVLGLSAVPAVLAAIILSAVLAVLSLKRKKE